MHKSTAQLDIFEVPDTADATVALVEEPLPLREDVPERRVEEEPPVSLCLNPSASIGECRECWERHPELRSRYITRANCVRHMR